MATAVTQSPGVNKSLLKAAVILLIAAAAAGGLYYLRSTRPIPQQQVAAFSVEKTDLQAAELPKGFPENLPTEAGARITENYDASTTDGRMQSTRVMVTSKSLAAAAEEYSSFFKELGWKTITGNTEGSTTILMLNGDDSLLIVGSEVNNERMISLTLTEVQ